MPLVVVPAGVVDPRVVEGVMGPTDRVCFSSEEAARLARPAVVFDKTAKRIALLAGTLALIRRQEVCGNHWDYYGSASTATAVMQVYYLRAGEIPAAMEAPVRYRRDLMTIIKGDVQVAKTREDKTPVPDGPAVVVLGHDHGLRVISTKGRRHTTKQEVACVVKKI